MLKYVINNGLNKKCSTYDRWNRECLKAYMTKDDYTRYVSLTWEVGNYATLGTTNGQQCIDKVVNYEYYYVNWTPDHDDSDDDNDDQRDDSPDEYDDSDDGFCEILMAGIFSLLL